MSRRGPVPDKSPDRPTVPDVLPLVRRLYQLDGAGGPLHIVLDDYNIDDGSIQFCLDALCDETDYDGETVMLSREIGTMLLQMTLTQRRRVYDLVPLCQGFTIGDV